MDALDNISRSDVVETCEFGWRQTLIALYALQWSKKLRWCHGNDLKATTTAWHPQRPPKAPQTIFQEPDVVETCGFDWWQTLTTIYILRGTKNCANIALTIQERQWLQNFPSLPQRRLRQYLQNQTSQRPGDLTNGKPLTPSLVFYLTGVIKIEILYFLQWFVRVLGCTEPLQKELKYL